MARYVRLSFATVILLLWGVAASLAASASVISSGGGTYTIQGDNMDGVSGIELNLSYDNSSLATPSVSAGGLISGALMAANTANSGTIKIAVISTKTFTGSGPIAVVTFASKKGNGGLSIVSANMLDSKGAPIGTGSGSSDSGVSSAPGIPFSPSSTSTTAPTSGTGASAAPSYLGTVTVPADTPPAQAAPKPPETAGMPAQPPAEAFTPAGAGAGAKPAEQHTVAKAEESRKSDEIRFTTYTAVLERFRTYQG